MATKFVDVTLFWPYLKERNTLSNKFQVDMAQLSDAQVESLEDAGVTVRNKGDDRGNYITAKSANYEIKAYDTKGNELKDVRIGNGTKATIVWDTYSWKSPTGKKGVSLSIKKLTVTELVEYAGNEASSDDVEEVL